MNLCILHHPFCFSADTIVFIRKGWLCLDQPILDCSGEKTWRLVNLQPLLHLLILHMWIPVSSMSKGRCIMALSIIYSKDLSKEKPFQ